MATKKPTPVNPFNTRTIREAQLRALHGQLVKEIFFESMRPLLTPSAEFMEARSLGVTNKRVYGPRLDDAIALADAVIARLRSRLRSK